jgi:hypothetical protein
MSSNRKTVVTRLTASAGENSNTEMNRNSEPDALAISPRPVVVGLWNERNFLAAFAAAARCLLSGRCQSRNSLLGRPAPLRIGAA